MEGASRPVHTSSEDSKATHGKIVALEFIGAVLVFVGLLNGMLSARAGSGPDIFDAILFISGISALIAGTIFKARAEKRRAP